MNAEDPQIHKGNIMQDQKSRKYQRPKKRNPRVQTPVGGPSMTKQSFKDECNINKIMEKFQKTGAMNHYAKHAPSYGDATPCELHDAQNIIANANTMFEELPSNIRKKFENDPAKFLEFVQDEKNHDEMVELGLKESNLPSLSADGPEVTQSKHASASQSDDKQKEGEDVGQES